MRHYTLFLLCFVLSIANVALAQNRTTNVRFNEISENEKAAFTNQARENIKNLGYRLNLLANEDNPVVKENIIEAQLDYFTASAKFETGSIDRKNNKVVKRSMSVRDYLTNTVAKYKKSPTDILDIEFASFEIDSKLIPVPGKLNEYYFEFSFTQVFRRGKKSKRKNKEGIAQIDHTYVDQTKKVGKVYITKKNTVLGSKWALYFGDVLVEDVKI